MNQNPEIKKRGRPAKVKPSPANPVVETNLSTLEVSSSTCTGNLTVLTKSPKPGCSFQPIFDEPPKSPEERPAVPGSSFMIAGKDLPMIYESFKKKHKGVIHIENFIRVLELALNNYRTWSVWDLMPLKGELSPMVFKDLFEEMMNILEDEGIVKGQIAAYEYKVYNLK